MTGIVVSYRNCYYSYYELYKSVQFALIKLGLNFEGLCISHEDHHWNDVNDKR